MNLSTHLFTFLSTQSAALVWAATTAIYLCFAVVICFKLSYWIYLWQLKEYRNDRMIDFFTTQTGKRALLNMWFGIEVALTLVLTLGAFPLPWVLIESAAVVFVALQAARYLKHRIMPRWTMKALLLECGGVVFIALFFFWGVWMSVSELFLVMVLMVVVPVVVTALVVSLRPFIAMHHRRVFEQARQRIAALHPIVIGITGSYGKTSTKDFLQTILSQSASVLATPKHVNVDIGVAQTVLKSLTPEHQYFIVEMGAYREGEIQSTCSIVSPMVGVLMAIGEQHLSLFGSLDAVQRAKSELLAALPSSGVAVINADDPRCVAAAAVTPARQRFFSLQQQVHVHATDVVALVHCVRFTLHIRERAAAVEAPLHGIQAIPSLLAAATVADYFGLSMEQIVRGIESVTPVSGTMQLKRGINGCSIIDDSYNSNPSGFIAALDYLALFSDKRKIVITPGMLELGAQSDRHHRTVGARIGEVADVCVITKQDFSKSLRDGMKVSGMHDTAIIQNDRPRRVCETLLQALSPDDVVLIEGRVHPYYHEYLLSE